MAPWNIVFFPIFLDGGSKDLLLIMSNIALIVIPVGR